MVFSYSLFKIHLFKKITFNEYKDKTVLCYKNMQYSELAMFYGDTVPLE